MKARGLRGHKWGVYEGVPTCAQDAERLEGLCYTEKAPNVWHRRGTPNGRKHLPSAQMTVNWHNSQNKHQALSKGQPRSQDAQQTSTAAVHAPSTATTRHHHPHPTGSPPDPPSQRSPLRSTGGLSRTTRPPLQRGHAAHPRLGGAHSQEWLMDSQGRTASLFVAVWALGHGEYKFVDIMQ